MDWSRLRLHIRACAALVALVVCVPGTARADAAAARGHFTKGVELYDARRYEAALAEFERAYEEKPSATIKQNIALSLKAMNEPARAATAFDEALEEGKGTLSPETRGAIERELSELSRSIATVNVRGVGPKREVVEDFTVVIRSANAPERQLPPGATRRPIRLIPGIYTLRARALGHADPVEKKLALVSGAPVDVTFDFGAARGEGAAANQGTLTVTASPADAVIRIDGAEVGRGRWTGAVAAGPHAIEVSASGWKTTRAEVVVGAEANVEFPVRLAAVGEAPAEYTAPALKPSKTRRIYVLVSGALDGVSYRLSDDLGEPQGGARRTLGGGAIGIAGGLLLGKRFAVELFADTGVVSASYKLRPTDDLESSTKITHWQVLPMLRYRSSGKFRFTAGTGFGVHGVGVESKLARSGSTLRKEGRGVAFAWLADAGVQLDVDPVFFEGVLFVDVHGVGPVRDDTVPNDRLLLASPAARAGIRIGVGIPF